MGPRVSYWQVTLKSGAGQSMTFGLEAPDKASAFQRALSRAPGSWEVPVSFSITEVPPLCAAHQVRHACDPRFEPSRRDAG